MVVGSVYKIVSPGPEVYIGSTFNTPTERFKKHIKEYLFWKKTNKRQITSYLLFDKYGYKNCKVELIKEYQVEDRKHLEAKEQLWIKRIKNSVNMKDALALKNISLQNAKIKTQEEWHCKICDRTIKLNKKSRHLKSKIHERNVNNPKLKIMKKEKLKKEQERKEIIESDEYMNCYWCSKRLKVSGMRCHRSRFHKDLIHHREGFIKVMMEMTKAKRRKTALDKYSKSEKAKLTRLKYQNSDKAKEKKKESDKKRIMKAIQQKKYYCDTCEYLAPTNGKLNRHFKSLRCQNPLKCRVDSSLNKFL